MSCEAALRGEKPPLFDSPHPLRAKPICLVCMADATLTPEITRGRTTRLAWIVRGFLLLLVLAGIGFRMYLGEYQPLQLSNMSSLNADTESVMRGGEGPDTIEFLKSAPPGTTFRMMLSLENTGWLPVTITALADPHEMAVNDVTYGFRPTTTLLGPKEEALGVTGTSFAGLEEFEPFTLEPGEARLAGFEFMSGKCIARESSTWDSTSELTFKVLGVQRKFQLEWPYVIAMTGQSCRV